jgi:hypothetical protein
MLFPLPGGEIATATREELERRLTIALLPFLPRIPLVLIWLLSSCIVSAAVLDFDSIPSGTTVSNQFLGQAIGVFGAEVMENSYGGTVLVPSPPNYLTILGETALFSFQLNGRPAVTDRVTFDSLGLTDSGGYLSGATVNALDLHGNLIATAIVQPVGPRQSRSVSTTSFSVPGIHAIIFTRIENPAGPALLAIDNLSFNSPVPIGDYYSQTVLVPGTANIFGAGHTIPPDPAGGGGGTPPVLIVVPPGTAYITFPAVTGTVSTDPADPNGPDGRLPYSYVSDVSSFDGISGIRFQTRLFPLTGVFLNDREPADPAPERLIYDETTVTLGSFSPMLRQTFFIGDGLTGAGSGAIQKFLVPTGTTRLLLGFQDASYAMGLPGYYDDNGGQLIATVNLVGAAISFVMDDSVSISGVRCSQRSRTTLVDLSYDLSGTGSNYSVSVVVSADGGATFVVPATHFTGVGVTSPASPGTRRHIVWDAGADFPGEFSTRIRIKLMLGAIMAMSPIFTLDTRTVSTGTLTGLVQGNGAPLPGALLGIDKTPFVTSTGSDGRFTIGPVSAGSGYLLNVTASGFASKHISGATVSSGPLDLGNIQLAPLNGPYRVIPLQPDVNPTISDIEEGGEGYRYYRIVTADGLPAGGITITLQLEGGVAISQQDDARNFWPGVFPGTSDWDGIVRLRIPASSLFSLNSPYRMQVLASGTVQQTFTAQLVSRMYDQIWKQKLGSGLSVGEFLSAGVDISGESEVRHSITDGTLVRETISRKRTVDASVSLGADIGSSLSVSSERFNFVGGGEASAGVDAFAAVGFNSTFRFDPNSSSSGENAMKLYVDLGNVLAGVPGPQAAFYEFVDNEIAPLFLNSNLQSVEGDVQLGRGVQGDVVFGFPVVGTISVDFQATASDQVQAVLGEGLTFTAPQEIATVKGEVVNGSVLTIGGVDLGAAALTGLIPAGAQFDWQTSANVETLTKLWRSPNQSSVTQTEFIRKVGFGAGQQVPFVSWQLYDPKDLYLNYEREFTETVDQLNGNNMATYRRSVYAGKQQFGASLNLDVGLGVNLNGELDEGAETVNERGAISLSRYWPTESYPAITVDRFPTQSLTSLLSQWGDKAVDPIGQALNEFWTSITAGADTVIQVGRGTTLLIRNGAMLTGSWIVTRVVNPVTGAGPLLAGHGHPARHPKGTGPAVNLAYGIGGIYRFESTNSLNGTGALTIAYSPAEVAGFKAADLRLYYLPDGSNRWQYVGGTVDVASNSVTSSIDRLGTYTLAPPMPIGDLELVPTTNTLAADGISQMAITVTNIALNTGEVLSPGPDAGSFSGVATQQWMFTATGSGVSILNADLDPTTRGVQVLSSNGAVGLVLRAQIGGTVARVNLASVAGDASGTVAINLADNTPPAAPTGVKITAAQSRIWVLWQTNNEPDIAGYRVYYRLGQSGPPWDGSAAVEGTASPVMTITTNCLLRGLTVGTNYFVAVSAVDTTGNESLLSVPIPVATTLATPMAPTEVTVRFSGGGTNILMWALSEDDGYNDRSVVGYDVWRAVLPGGNYVNIGKVPAGTGLFIDQNVTLIQSQYVSYVVTAIDASGLVSPQAFASPLISGPWINVTAIAADGTVQLNVNGTPGLSYTIRMSTNLVDWATLQTFVSTNTTTTVLDSGRMNSPYRFYKVLVPYGF